MSRNDLADAADTIIGSTTGDLLFGNGGNDAIDGGAGANTLIGGQGNNCLFAGTGADLIFASEANDTVSAGAGANTAFGGQGNDTILGGAGRETIQGNEGNDTTEGDGAVGISIDTISGGAGNDVFAYADGEGDGNNAAGGGPVEQITDLDWSVDCFDTIPNMTFATNMGTGIDLATSATNAINAAAALGGTQAVAAQFTFGGRTYLAINTDLAAGFIDAGDLLLDISGFTGTIATTNFI